MGEEQLAQPTVPFWALNLVADTSAIKARTDRLPVIERELAELRADQVPLSEFKDLQSRTNALWDAWQRGQGARSRDRLWMTGLTLLTVLVGLLQTLHLLGVIS